jgi:uncharacterized protein YndB with AHSA1/START domain/uncharacterized protein YciI
MTLPPLRRQILVGCDQATAYRHFVEEIGAWWPLGSHSCFGAGGRVALEGDSFVETGPDGQTAVWGTITAADEPRMLSYTWHPGRAADERVTQVTVSFTETGDDHTTLVTVLHAGWETYPEPAAAREDYARGWPAVLDTYGENIAGSSPTEELWFVLSFTPGPAVPPEAVFASPDLGKHIEFLQGLAARGVLVAAGPLPDAVGSGMTVVRARGLAEAQQILRSAQLDDGSVTAGLFDLEVRPWHVMLSSAERP